MPYNPNRPPRKLSDYPKKLQRQWVHVFNSCMGRGGDEGKCHAMAYSVVNREMGKSGSDRSGRYREVEPPAMGAFDDEIDGIETAVVESLKDQGGVDMGKEACIMRWNRQMVARELLVVARELSGASFQEEAKALRMKGYVQDFSKAVGKFRHDANEFVDRMTAAVENPSALREFPFLRAVLGELREQKRGLLPMTFLDDRDLMSMLERVVCKDSGSC